MKRVIYATLFVAAFAACKKNNDIVQEQNMNSTADQGRSGSSGSGSGSGSTTTSGLISGIGGAFRLIGGNNDSIQVNFTEPAPAGGWNLTLSTSDPAVNLPSTYFVTEGTLYAHIPLSSSVIPFSKNVAITASLLGESKSYILKVFPLNYNFPAPALKSPGSRKSFKNRIQVKFEWSGNINAYYHDIQISDDTAFTDPMLEVYTNDPIWAASYFNGLGIRYWRVRYVDGSGSFGPWSEVRSFEIKQ